ncbi:MAG: hypothetical protein EXS64_20665 [Candidatus Latescibacteria bacterium]|nr:hypothetical protein [Candidatus Latescibacterota bacterium]
MTRFWFLALLLCGAWIAGCGEEKLTVQDNLKGTWKLTARTLPDGTTLNPPDVAGLMEWFAINDRRGHVTVVITRQQDGQKAYDFENNACTVSASAFSMERSLLMGRSYLNGDGPVETDTAPKSLEGRLTVDGKKTTLTYGNGVVQAFEGSSLTVTLPNRYADTWKKE